MGVYLVVGAIHQLFSFFLLNSGDGIMKSLGKMNKTM